MRYIILILIVCIQHMVYAQSEVSFPENWDWAIERKYNNVTNTWHPNYTRITRTYNFNGKVEMDLSERFDSVSNVWSQSSKKENVYNNADEHIERIYSYMYNGSWDARYKTLFFYTNNLRTERVQEIKSFGAWEQKTKVTMSYSQDDNLDEVISYSKIDSNWIHGSKTKYFYDANLLNNETEYYSWDTTYSVWNLGAIGLLSYTNNLLTQKHLHNFIYRDAKLEYTYNTDGLLNERAYYEWNAQSATWKGNTRNIAYYDTDNRLEFIENYTWDDIINFWELDSKVYFYYNEPLILQGISESFNLYPQPCESELNIENLPEYNSINIYDISGQKVLGYKNNGEHILQMHQFMSGVYILECVTSSKIYRQKIIKR